MHWRLAFAGAPAFAATILQQLIDSPHRVELVYSQPDRRAGRGRKLVASPVRTLAEAAGIAVRTPVQLEGEEEEGAEAALAAFDFLVVAAYGLLLPPAILNAPKHGCLNVHSSLLPRWRGAAPVERAIMAGDRETGVSIMQMDAGLDTGPVYCQRHMALGASATGAETTSALAVLGAQALLDTLNALPDMAPTPQDDRLATYATKLAAADACIDWRHSADVIARQIRALSGRSAAYAAVGGARLRILDALPLADRNEGRPPGLLSKSGKSWQVVCGAGVLELRTVQLNRGKGTPQPMQSAANGYPRLLFDGARLDAVRENRD